MYDDDGKVAMMGPIKVEWPAGKFFTPCDSCPKIPRGVPKTRDNAIELSWKNLQAYTHWKICRAVNQFPDDWIVRRNAAIIQEVYDEFQRAPMQDLLALIVASKTME